MNFQAIETAQSGGVADILMTLVQSEGSRTHRYPAAPELLGGSEATRNLADVAHYLCVLHGRQPGVIDYAAQKSTHAAARGWLAAASEAFAEERGYLTRLAVAAGPLPSTPGQAESEAAVLHQRHALEMLAQSDRAGCALGAALALALDWRAIRSVLDTAAVRLGLEPPTLALPDERETRTVVMAVADSAAVERALGFGAQQILAQHRGLWDLLEARKIARAQN